MTEYFSKVVPNVAKTKQKIEKGSHLLVSLVVYRIIILPLSAILVHLTQVLYLGPLSPSLNYNYQEWLKSSVSANAVEFDRVVPLLCNDPKVLQEGVIFKVWLFELKVISKEKSDNIDGLR